MNSLRASLVTAVLLLAGCSGEGDFDRLRVRDVSTPPSDVKPRPRLEGDEILLVEGVALGARVSAMDDEQEPLDLLDLESSDPDVFGVARGPEWGRYVFYGVAEGVATLRVYADQRQVGELTVTVETEQR